MQKILSPKSLTNKYIHSDNSETSIKLLPSGKFSEEGQSEFRDRNKYSIIISASLGCAMACNFCHITQKNSPFKRIDGEAILSNIKEAIEAEYEINPQISEKYIKLCWMGMGEAILISKEVKYVTLQLLDWVMENNYAKGLDGVDLATVLPKINNGWMDDFTELNLELKKYEINPNNDVVPNAGFSNLSSYDNRSSFRLFYSLHSSEQSVRDVIIPNAMPIDKAMLKIKQFHESTGINIILHYMFMEGVNDSDEQVNHLMHFMQEYSVQNYELRILRYNGHEENIEESLNFKPIIKKISSLTNHFKVQFSSGFEVKSACGQFIVNGYAESEHAFVSKARNNNEINFVAV